MRTLSVTAVAVAAMFVLSGCGVLGGVATGGASRPADSSAPTAAEQELLTHLRTTGTAQDELAELTDDDLLAVAQAICAAAEEGQDLDAGLRAITDQVEMSDATIVALMAGAQVTYCPEALDTAEWAESSILMKERLFLRNVRSDAGSFGSFDDATSLGYARAVCEAALGGSSVLELVAALHSVLPAGTAPDQDGAVAFIAASVAVYCPEADLLRQ